jgi:2-oxoglutarate dehydrogenase E1 component
VLRRQVVRPWRKPLVVFTPKSLLRHALAVSPLEECSRGRFERVLSDPLTAPTTATRVLLCSGKIYYDLLEARRQRHREDVAIVRLEQLYPLPDPQLRAVLAAYPDQVPVYWVQEEPENMGAAAFLRCRFCQTICGHPVGGWITRSPSASPATGSHSSHRLEQQEIIDKAFGLT